MKIHPDLVQKIEEDHGLVGLATSPSKRQEQGQRNKYRGPISPSRTRAGTDQYNGWDEVDAIIKSQEPHDSSRHRRRREQSKKYQ